MSLLQALGMVRDKGMPLQQLEILLLLGQADEPLNQAEIGRLLNMSQPAVSRNTRKLGTQFEKRGGKRIQTGYQLTDSFPDPYDPRNITVQLNPAGIEFLKHFYELSAR